MKFAKTIYLVFLTLALSTQAFASGNDAIALRSAKIPVLNIPGMYDDLLGKSIDTRTYIPWRELISHIKSVGFNDVTLVVSGGTLTNYNDCYFDPADPYNPPPEAIASLIQVIHGQGMTVTLSPFYNIDGGIISGDPSKAGMDRPMPSDRAVFIKSLEAQILKWLNFAAKNKVEHFIIFTDEIQHLTLDPSLLKSWDDIFKKARAAYKGVISSGFTYDLGLKIPEPIINNLDIIGIGYFPELSRKDLPRYDELVHAYYYDLNEANSPAALDYLANRYKKKIWITDKAFHSFEGAGYDISRVFNEAVPLKSNYDIQSILYDSFFSVMAHYSPEWFYGVSIQNYNNVITGRIDLPRYMNGECSESPQGKPAEAVLRKWFSGSPEKIKIFTPPVVDLSLTTRLELTLSGIKTAGKYPILSISQKGNVLLWKEIGAEEKIRLYVDLREPVILTNENWDFIDFSETGNRFFTLQSLKVDGKERALDSLVEYIAAYNYQSEHVGKGKTSTVHGGYLRLLLK